MASPTATTRTTPTGKILEDGFSTKIAFSRVPGVNFWEKSVKPPGVDGGEKIDITSMHNTLEKTFAARRLVQPIDPTVKAFYDPGVLSQIYQLVNQPGSVTFRFSDGTTWTRWGYLQSFDPDELTEGEAPMASIKIAITNYDPTNDVEASYVLTDVTGT